MNIAQKKFFCSWSGGKDSCLALYSAIKEGGLPSKLITMLIENGQRSRSHGLSLDIIKKQAQSLKISLVTCSTSWKNYEANFLEVLKKMKTDNINYGIFGDIDIDEHREWVHKVCKNAGIEAYHPLWKKSRRDVIDEFITAGFKAVIVVVKEGVLDKSYLGRILDKSLIEEFIEIGIDPAGENGEYHTVVTAGPIFSLKIEYKLKEQIYSDGYWFQNLSVL